MTTPRDPDVTIATWLEDGPLTLPSTSRQIVAASIQLTPQRRRPLVRLPWRFPIMNTPVRVGTAAVIGLLVLGAGIYLFAGSGPGVGGAPATATPTASPTPSPDSSPTTPIDTSDWLPFVSHRYGYELSYPPTHAGVAGSKSSGTDVSRAERDWSIDTDRGSGFDASAAMDGFSLGPEGRSIFVSALASQVPAGMAEDEWFEAVNMSCPTRTLPEGITVDGHQGRFEVGCDASVATVIVDDRAYVFAEWHGKYPDLLKAFLSTVRFSTPSPAGSPSAAP